MKKLTTNQLLMAGGVIALIYILYKKKKAKNGSEMIQDALNGEGGVDNTSDVSVSDGDKDTSEQGSPIISSGGGKTKPCAVVQVEFDRIRKTSRMSEKALEELRIKMFKGCTGGVKPIKPTRPTLPPLKIKGGSRGQLAGITI